MKFNYKFLNNFHHINLVIEDRQLSHLINQKKNYHASLLKNIKDSSFKKFAIAAYPTAIEEVDSVIERRLDTLNEEVLSLLKGTNSDIICISNYELVGKKFSLKVKMENNNDFPKKFGKSIKPVLQNYITDQEKQEANRFLNPLNNAINLLQRSSLSDRNLLKNESLAESLAKMYEILTKEILKNSRFSSKAIKAAYIIQKIANESETMAKILMSDNPPRFKLDAVYAFYNFCQSNNAIAKITRIILLKSVDIAINELLIADTRADKFLDELIVDFKNTPIEPAIQKLRKNCALQSNKTSNNNGFFNFFTRFTKATTVKPADEDVEFLAEESLYTYDTPSSP